MINALQGTRMGRKVKTPAEVIAEAREWARSEQVVDIEPTIHDEEQVIPRSRLDIFSFSALEVMPTGALRLKDLEVPSGHWNEITLSRDFYCQGARLAPEDWHQYSTGEYILLKNGKLKKGGAAPEYWQGITPFKVQYWFMRAIFEARNRASSGPQSFLGSLRTQVFEQVCNADSYKREQNRLPIDQKYYLSYQTQGWPSTHPFSTVGLLLNPLFKDLPYETDHDFVERFLYGVTEDCDKERINRVLNYVAGTDFPLRIDLTKVTASEGPFYLYFQRKSQRDAPELILRPSGTGNFTRLYLARPVLALEKNFIPRDVKQ